MEKIILPIGLLASMSLTIGSIFKLMHMPGANFMMYGGLMFFFCLFAPLWMYNRMNVENMSKLDTFRWRIGVMSGIAFAVRNLFELLHYSGSGILMFAGGMFFAFLYLPATFYGIYQQQVIT